MESLINIIFRVAQALIFALVVVSWVPSLRYHPAGRWVNRTVDPWLRPLRRLLPPWKTGGLDFSPLLAFIVLEILREVALAVV